MRVEAIRCEACNGYGTVYVGPTNKYGLPNAVTVDSSQMRICQLCHGTGTERPHESMTVTGVCPRCGGEAHRDEVDVGVGVVTGPWGCGCGWSEQQEYDGLFGGGVRPDGSYRDPFGGILPAANPIARKMAAAESGTERPPEDKAAQDHVEGRKDDNGNS